MSKNLLITGGLGFIGSYCIERWKRENWDITVIDNLSTNVINPNDPIMKNVNFINDDIINVKWESCEKFDKILHLASPVGPIGVLKHSGVMGQIILDDIYWAINGAKYNKCPLIFVSTSEIYGHRTEKSYLKEQDDKVLHGSFTVRNEYAVAKLLSEIVLANTGKIDKDFTYQIVRPFNVTGARQLPDGGFVLPRFVNQAINNQDITVYYSGEQIRAFTWVQDIVEGIYLISETQQYKNEEWNVGNVLNENSILYLAKRVKELTNTKSNIVHVDPTVLHGPLFAEAPEKIPDASKIVSKLGWKPTKNVDEIIDEVVAYYVNK
jgi:nucleoside-diphosphate-sugar epimerase